MATIAHAAADDGYVSAEDEDYDPSKDATCEPEDRVGSARKASGFVAGKRRGGLAALDGELEPDAAPGAGAAERNVSAQEQEEEEEEDGEAQLSTRDRAKAARVDAALESLGSGGVRSAAAGGSVLARLNLANARKAAAPTKAGAKKGGGGGGAGGKRKRDDGDESWRRMLGGLGAVAKPPEDKDEAARREAREALKAAAGAVRVAAPEHAAGTVTVTEERDFAGNLVAVSKSYAAGSKQAREAEKRQQAKQAGGIDSVLLELEKKKKLSVLDKSKMDWGDAKAKDATIEDDLNAHLKSGETHLEKQDFLQRADVRQYELERDARLANDPRARFRVD